MPSSYEERIVKLQKEAMKPNLTRAREEKINTLITKYKGLITKRDAKSLLSPRVPRNIKKKTYEEQIAILQQKIIERDAKNKGRKPESLKLPSTFTGPLLPTQTRARTKETIAQQKQDRATAKRLVKEALMVARMEARNLKKNQKEASKLIRQGRRSTARAGRISAGVSDIIM